MLNQPFDFKKCRESQRFVVPAWFQHYVPLDEATLQYWEWQYQLAKQGLESQIPEWSLRHPANELHQLMSKAFWGEVPKDFSTILDIGCSDGYMVKVFQDAGKKAVGINEILIAVDRAFLEANGLDVRVGDMHSLPFQNATFDAVWCRHTLEHSFAPLQVLAEIHRVLKPKGYAFIVLPPPPQPPEPFPDHWNQIPDYQLRYLLECCNFEVEKMWTAWFSYKSENDNLEIRCISRKVE